MIIMTMAMVSCNDDFIEVENKQSLTEESFWQTEEHALQAITSAYGAMQSASGSKWAFFEEMFTSMGYRGDDVLNNTGETYGRTLASFSNTTEENGPFNIWQAAYSGIGRANQVIAKVPEMDVLSDDVKNGFVAEGKFLRALYYFWLVTGFENVPLVTTFETDPAKFYPSQATMQDIWSQIETDLKDAEINLPISYSDENKGRATKGAAKALLGKAYLFQEKWGEAETKLGEVVGMSYGLLENYADNFNGKGENGIEAVFEIQFTGDRSNSNDERQVLNFQVSPSIFGGWELFYPSQWIVDEMKTDIDEDGNISERVYESIFFDDTESKMYNMDSDNMTSYPDVATSLNHPKYFKKYSQNEDTNFYNGTNISIIRFADVLLMYAEALNENNKTDQAITEVNKVRARGKAKPITLMSKDELRTQIRHHERPVELAMEFGIRWFDLYRWGSGSTATEGIKATLLLHDKPSSENYQDKHRIFPIPLQEINTNKNLEQNTGW